MILARGCSSRLLVLAAQGNLRSVMSGLVFAVTAQSALDRRALAAARSHLGVVDGGRRRRARPDRAHRHRPRRRAAVRRGVAGRRGRLGAAPEGAPWGWAGAIGVGLAIAAAWWFTYAVTQGGLRPAPDPGAELHRPVGRGADRVLFVGDKPPNFDLGLVPGVFIGSFLAAALFGELKLEGFTGRRQHAPLHRRRHADGLRRHARRRLRRRRGPVGRAVFTITSWVTLCAMWAAAALTDRLVDQRPRRFADQPRAPPPTCARCQAARFEPEPRRHEDTRPAPPSIAAMWTLAFAHRRAAGQADLAARRGDRPGQVLHLPRCRRRELEPGVPAPGRPERGLRGAPAGRLQERQAQEQHDAADGGGPVPADFKALGEYFEPTVGPPGRRPRPGRQVGASSTSAATRTPAWPPAPPATGRRPRHRALPRLAGQHAQYTENQLKQFNKRERTNDNAVMHGIASKLTELELKAVAAYISGLK
jgi:hypothetical protein